MFGIRSIFSNAASSAVHPDPTVTQPTAPSPSVAQQASPVRSRRGRRILEIYEAFRIATAKPTLGPREQAEAELCKILRYVTKRLKSRQKRAQMWGDVASNKTNVRCGAEPVEVNVCDLSRRFRKKTLHANRISMEEVFPGDRSYLVGQSPDDWRACQNFLVQGIDSGRGLFQFVSEQQQADPTRIGHARPILNQLRDKFEEAKRAGEGPNGTPLLHFAGRFQIEGIDDTTNGNNADQGADHSRCTIRFIDINDRESGTQTMLITQVGLPFTGRVLDVDQIKRAAELFDQHCALLKDQPTDTTPAQMFVSTAGAGRNATLMVYHELSRHIRNRHFRTEAALDRALVWVILQGRVGRGYRFVHSEAQVVRLRRALMEVFNEVMVPGSGQGEPGEVGGGAVPPSDGNSVQSAAAGVAPNAADSGLPVSSAGTANVVLSPAIGSTVHQSSSGISA